MLRASSEVHEEAVDLTAVADAKVVSGVPHGKQLIGFAEAVVTGDPALLDAARSAVVDAMGGDALVDAAGVASNFERMVRIADATGIPLNPDMESATADLRAELGLEKLKERAD